MRLIKLIVICENHGEWDDYTKNPMFACESIEEANLFIDALRNKEPELWNEVIKFFGDERYVPKDVDFGWEEVRFLSL